MQTLVFKIYDYDRFTKHDQIGLIQLPLNSMDIGVTIREWRNIELPPKQTNVIRFYFRIFGFYT